MTELLIAIFAKFNTALVPSVFANPLYADRIPSGGAVPAYPYCIYGQILGKKMTRTFGKLDIEFPAIQFDAYANTKTAALTSIQSVTNTFDYVTLTLTSGVAVACVRRREPDAGYEGRDQNNNDVYRGTVQYDFIIQK
jgi:hypothetical protein